MIYTLAEPNNAAEIRYVGWCYAERVLRRFSEHVGRARNGYETTPKAAWINGLLSDGHLPQLAIQETITADERETKERYWIGWHRDNGARLTNSADGGKGCPGFRHNAAAKAKMSARLAGVPKSPEHRCRLAESKRNRKASEATRAKMSAAHSGRKMSPEAVKKSALAHTGMKRSDITRERMRQSWAKRKQSAAGRC